MRAYELETNFHAKSGTDAKGKSKWMSKNNS